MVDAPTLQPRPPVLLGALLLLPAIALVLLLAVPQLDLHWEHHPSHFWLVLIAAAVNVALAYTTNLAAARHRDARLVLISLAFLASSGFLGLHALATPGVLLADPNVGFAIATPVGLILASFFAGAATTTLAGPRAMAVLRVRRLLLGISLGVMVAWAVASLAGLPPLDGPPPPREGAGVLDVMSVVAVAIYGFAAWRLVGLYRIRGGVLLLAIAMALVLLAQALVAVLVSRNWQLSWWEWHLLLLAAFATIAVAARREYQRRGSLTATFGGLYLDATLAKVERWYASAVAAVSAAEAGDRPTGVVLDRLRREGATEEELALLERTAHELRRLDATFRPYLPGPLRAGIRGEAPSAGVPRAVERVVTSMFADLAGFTTYSETHPPARVVEMLNTYWAVVVPIIDRAGGTIEHFAGDGVLALFNATGDQPDHARRAVRAATEIVGAAGKVAGDQPGWPIFRIGINTGSAVVGVVGSDERRSFSAIGDAVNTAARLMTVGAPGDVVVGPQTWASLADPDAGAPLGPVRLKGKRDPVDAWRLRLT